MKFELEAYNRNVPDEDLLNDLRKVAKEFGRETIPRDEYSKRGKYHSTTLGMRFGSWNKALEKAGLALNQTVTSDEDLLSDLKRVAREMRKITITANDYNERGKYHADTLIRRFNGQRSIKGNGWNNALEKAGLEVTQYRNIDADELFENIEMVWIKLGRQPHYADMRVPLSKYGGKMYVNRFGTWRKALEQFVEFINFEEVETEQSIETNPEIETEQFIDIQSEIKSHHKTKRNINWRLRFLVMRRDNFKCNACGKSPTNNPGTELHIDHIVAWDKGGETIFKNLQTLCSICNIGKSNLDFNA